MIFKLSIATNMKKNDATDYRKLYECLLADKLNGHFIGFIRLIVEKSDENGCLQMTMRKMREYGVGGEITKWHRLAESLGLIIVTKTSTEYYDNGQPYREPYTYTLNVDGINRYIESRNCPKSIFDTIRSSELENENKRLHEEIDILLDLIGKYEERFRNILGILTDAESVKELGKWSLADCYNRFGWNISDPKVLAVMSHKTLDNNKESDKNITT